MAEQIIEVLSDKASSDGVHRKGVAAARRPFLFWRRLRLHSRAHC